MGRCSNCPHRCPNNLIPLPHRYDPTWIVRIGQQVLHGQLIYALGRENGSLDWLTRWTLLLAELLFGIFVALMLQVPFLPQTGSISFGPLGGVKTGRGSFSKSSRFIVLETSRDRSSVRLHAPYLRSSIFQIPSVPNPQPFQ
jgi:hypothetical protein